MFKEKPEGTTHFCESCEYPASNAKHTCGISPLQPSKEECNWKKGDLLITPTYEVAILTKYDDTRECCNYHLEFKTGHGKKEGSADYMWNINLREIMEKEKYERFKKGFLGQMEVNIKYNQ
jgi:hypothetical protein